jgi:hypothetical protein
LTVSEGVNALTADEFHGKAPGIALAGSSSSTMLCRFAVGSRRHYY